MSSHPPEGIVTIVHQRTCALPEISTSNAPRVALAGDDPADLWAALAPLLAGQSRVRISRDRGKTYPQRYERELTGSLPSYPAAVRIYGTDGTCQAIFLDFDSSVDGIDRVDADVRRAQNILHEAGARWIEDYSPNGGRHLYVPLAERVPFHEARQIVEALALRLRSLDPTPHQNLMHGCMRTPGSRHKSGGHQLLAMSLPMAYDVARRRNTNAVWNQLNSTLARELKTVAQNRLATVPSPREAADRPDVRPGEISTNMLAVAVHGIFDTSKYHSPSEARQAVLLSAAGNNLTLTDIEARIHQGIWPGLAQLYARYSPRNRFNALRRDWLKAQKFLKKQGNGATNNSDRKNPTSQPPTQAPGTQGLNVPGSASEYQYLKSWQNALELLEHRYAASRAGIARRMILRAIGAAANMSGNRFVEFGVRSLAIASGVDHTTVAAHLRALRSETDSLITLVEKGRGVRGDLYLLSIPASIAHQAQERRWRKGRIQALRPAFRALGMPAALVYEALEHSPAAMSTADVVRATGFSRTTVNDALGVLEAWRLASRDEALGWIIHTGTSLALLAERLGVLEAVAARINRYKTERLKWRAWLASHTIRETTLPSPTEDYPWEKFEGPPDEWTLSDMAFSSP